MLGHCLTPAGIPGCNSSVHNSPNSVYTVGVLADKLEHHEGLTRVSPSFLSTGARDREGQVALVQVKRHTSSSNAVNYNGLGDFFPSLPGALDPPRPLQPPRRLLGSGCLTSQMPPGTTVWGRALGSFKQISGALPWSINLYTTIMPPTSQTRTIEARMYLVFREWDRN